MLSLFLFTHTVASSEFGVRVQIEPEGVPRFPPVESRTKPAKNSNEHFPKQFPPRHTAILLLRALSASPVTTFTLKREVWSSRSNNKRSWERRPVATILCQASFNLVSKVNILAFAGNFWFKIQN